MTLTEFINMGGYGTYVWSAYGITCLVLIINIVQPVLRERNTINDLLKRHDTNNENIKTTKS